LKLAPAKSDSQLNWSFSYLAGMLYKVMHTFIGAWMRIHLRRLFIRGLENVPTKEPIILTCNHGNAFLDAVIVAITLKRPVHFLTRADVFKKPFQRYILGKLKMIPVYRIRDGIDSLEQNTETFALCLLSLASTFWRNSMISNSKIF
jgi:1-acyl-sn-glycerol-3-phosphate acyltransferase